MERADLLKLVRWKMPYGKYSGLLLCDLPEHYVAFMVRSALPDGQLGGLILLLNEIQINGLMALLKPLREQS